MIHNKLKKMIAIAVSFSIVSTISPKTYANNFIVPRTISQKAISITQPYFPSNFAMKAFDTKNSNLLDSKKITSKSNGLITFYDGKLVVANYDMLDSIKLEEALGGQIKEHIEIITIANCKAIDDSTFSDCINLQNLNIANCNKIGSSAFSGCVNLKEVIISNCNEIGSSAFSGCKSLDIVKYQTSTEPIHGNDVFKDCSILKTVYVPAEYTGDSFCEIPVTKYTPTSTPTLKPKSNKTALIASTVSVAAAIVIAAVVSATCYFKNHPCFSQSNPDTSEHCTV